MKNILPLILAASFFFSVRPPVLAEDPPSEESVRELLNLLGWKKMHEGFLQGIELSVQASLRQFIRPQDESGERAFAAKAAGISAKIKEELKPEKAESIYIRVYRKNLTQREVEDMIAFYKSESGKSVMAKMPLINKQVGETIQPRAEAIFSEQLRKELAPFLRPLPGKE
jgi:hypothetical protein